MTTYPESMTAALLDLDQRNAAKRRRKLAGDVATVLLLLGLVAWFAFTLADHEHRLDVLEAERTR